MSNDQGGFPSNNPDQPADGSGGFPPAPGAPDPQYGGAPPPPQQQPQYGAQPDYGQAPPPPGQQPGYTAPPGYVAAGNGGMMKGPRPDVKVGGILVVAGAILTILGVFLPWASDGGQSVSGTDDFIFTSDGALYLAESPGTIPIVFAVIMLGLGIALIFAGRVLAVAIIAIVGAVIAGLIGLAMIGIASGLVDDNSGASLGIGAILQPVAPLLSLAGAIVATSKRRKMVPAGGQQGY